MVAGRKGKLRVMLHNYSSLQFPVFTTLQPAMPSYVVTSSHHSPMSHTSIVSPTLSQFVKRVPADLRSTPTPVLGCIAESPCSPNRRCSPLGGPLLPLGNAAPVLGFSLQDFLLQLLKDAM